MIVKAISRDVRPFDWRGQMKARARLSIYEGTESEPDMPWKIVKELGQRQAVFEAGRNRVYPRVNGLEMKYVTKEVRDTDHIT